MFKKSFIIILLFLCSYHIIGQVPDRSASDTLKLLRTEITKLKESQSHLIQKIDSILKSSPAGKESVNSEPTLDQLLKEADMLADKEPEEDADAFKKFHSGARQQQGLNPNISVGGDFFGSVSNRDINILNEPGELSYGNNSFFLREIELALEAPLDPFTRGKTFMSISKESISIEEAYMEWLNLPLNMNLKLGIFYNEFGPLNRYHDHALPQFDRPRALVNIFSNKGMGGTGLSANFMLPELLFAHATSLDVSVVRGNETGEEFIFTGKKLIYSGQFKNFYDISRNSYLEFRFSGAMGRNAFPGLNRSYLGSAGISYKWVPAGREKYRTFDWKTEILYCYYEQSGNNIKSIGAYSTIQNKLNARFWLGGRVGYSQLPYDSNMDEWDYTLNLDFWQSEFVFTRLQYQYNRRFIQNPVVPGPSIPDDHTLVIQICWAMGPHKHEAY